MVASSLLRFVDGAPYLGRDRYRPRLAGWLPHPEESRALLQNVGNPLLYFAGRGALFAKDASLPPFIVPFFFFFGCVYFFRNRAHLRPLQGSELIPEVPCDRQFMLVTGMSHGLRVQERQRNHGCRPY